MPNPSEGQGHTTLNEGKGVQKEFIRQEIEIERSCTGEKDTRNEQNDTRVSAANDKKN